MRNPQRVATCNQQRMRYSSWSNGQSGQSSTAVAYLAARFRVLVIGNVVLSYLYLRVLVYSLFLQSGVGKSSLINKCFGVTEAVRPLSVLLKSAHEAYPSPERFSLKSWRIKY